MNGQLETAIATFIGACTTVLLMWGASNFGPNGRRKRRQDADDEED